MAELKGIATGPDRFLTHGLPRLAFIMVFASLLVTMKLVCNLIDSCMASILIPSVATVNGRSGQVRQSPAR